MNQQEFEDTLQQFAFFLSSRGRKPSTIKRYVYDIEDFGRWLQASNRFQEESIWRNLDKRDFESYFQELQYTRKYSEKTIHRIAVVLKKLYQFLDIPSPIVEMQGITPPNRALRKEDFITTEEEKKLKNILSSPEGLSEEQLSVRPLLIERNVSILSLLLDYGLTLQELVSLQMQQIHFGKNMITVVHSKGNKRIIRLEEEGKIRLFTYYRTIPEPVRPRYHSTDPLFVAFDFKRGTFRWVYDNDAPKALTAIAVQKMLRLEVARAQLRKGISAQHLRNTFILRCLERNMSIEEIKKRTGFLSHLSVKRYVEYANQHSHGK
ncbi:tyrosine-type recombinase/integrase [Bacillus cereus]|uniref:tyrosine-type recombinase/integrase n=1 Tax=Bacillus cereus TaxID=1396 RepID=UPI000BF3C1A1|nr:phage integrase N-terminal SAM-like domain-containing protein [Bacillus cereus]PEV02426.1 integrase [Bacillus cereus]PGM68485.1 integrase [Bacillus cereus]HDR8449207.1 phage integrase N-terminal SAM-like domain-containing protein [Bacillus cereus]HDR8461065.1 phage integrase N-terminal SAM-like domain-containing protein [Bacillus cereus]